MKIAFLYEHPAWSDALMRAFRGRGVELDPFNVAELAFPTDAEGFRDYDLVVNRVNVMPSAERKRQVVFHTLHLLGWLETAGVRVVNGYRAHCIGASKAIQNGVFAKLGLAHPAAVAIHQPTEAIHAAAQIGYPLIIKPNIGGSGAGMEKFDSPEELEGAVRVKALDLGVDQTGLVQRYVNSDGYVYRVEMLGDELFYAIRQAVREGSFNYCATEGCSTGPDAGGDDADDAEPIQPFHPAADIVRNVAGVIRECGADVGGVEYLVDVETGQPVYYDFNPYSNFVADGERLLGFSAEERYVDFVCALAAK